MRPSTDGQASSLRPPTRSGAPFSSVLTCATSDTTTPPQRGDSAVSDTTFAPVPLSTGNASAPAPNTSRTRASSRAVHGSSPYATAYPSFAAATAARTSGCAGA